MSVDPSISVWTSVTSASSCPGQQPGACFCFEAFALKRLSSVATENFHQTKMIPLPRRQMTSTPQQTAMMTISTRLLVARIVQVAAYFNSSSTHSTCRPAGLWIQEQLEKSMVTKSQEGLKGRDRRTLHNLLPASLRRSQRALIQIKPLHGQATLQIKGNEHYAARLLGR